MTFQHVPTLDDIQQRAPSMSRPALPQPDFVRNMKQPVRFNLDMPTGNVPFRYDYHYDPNIQGAPRTMPRPEPITNPRHYRHIGASEPPPVNEPPKPLRDWNARGTQSTQHTGPKYSRWSPEGAEARARIAITQPHNSVVSSTEAIQPKRSALGALGSTARFGIKNLGKSGIGAIAADMLFPNTVNALGTHPDSGEEAGILNWKPSAQWNPNAPSALPPLTTQEAARTPIPTNYPSPPATATNQQHGSGNPDILKHYGSGYMQSEGNTTVMGSNGDMMRLNKGGYQMPASSGGALSTIPSAVESPSAEGMSASESMQRFGNVHGSYATNAMAQNQPQPPSWRNIYDDVTGNRGNMALHRWDEEDKIAKSVNDRYIGALKAYDSALGPINSQITADAHKYASDASRYGADQTARAHMYGADQTARASMYGHDQQLASELAKIKASGPLNMAQVNAHNAQANLANAQATSIPEGRKLAQESATEEKELNQARQMANNDMDKLPAALQQIQDYRRYSPNNVYVPKVPGKKATGINGWLNWGHPAIPEKEGRWVPKDYAQKQPDKATAELYTDIYGPDARNAFLQGMPVYR